MLATNIVIPALLSMLLFVSLMAGAAMAVYTIQQHFPEKIAFTTIKVLLFMLAEMLIICAWNH